MNASEAIEMSRFLQLLSLPLFLYFEGPSNNYGVGLADELRGSESEKHAEVGMPLGGRSKS